MICVVKGRRIPVYMVLELVEAGISFNEIRTKFYPQLFDEDIKVQFVKSLKPSGPLVFDIREFEVMLDF